MMLLIWCKALILLVAINDVRGAEEIIDENGFIRVDEGAYGIRPGESIMSVQNVRFPGMAPAKLIQTWRYIAHPDGALRIKCHQISLPQYSDGSCGSYSMTIEDGPDTEVLCGSIAGLSTLSKTGDITLTLRTGDHSRGLVNCTVQARKMGPYGEVTEPPTTQPPPPTQPAFMTMESEEIDSSEFGGPPGRVGTTCPCGLANKHMTRIIGGEVAKVNEYPFAAILTERELYFPFCGGSIVTRRHVLTAAHCREGREHKDLAVGIGDHDYKQKNWSRRRLVNVTSFIMHELYVKVNPYDIALLVLEEPINFNQFISPVCLPPRQLSLDWQYLTSMGWGRIGWGTYDPSSRYLKKVKVRAVPLDLCGRYIGVNAALRHQICTYSRNRGLAKGDSGGPTVWLDPDTNRYTLVGATSFGFNYTTLNYLPDVIVDVSSFLPWIHDKIRRTDSSAVTCRSLN